MDFIEKLKEKSFDTWRELNYSTNYMYYPEEVMNIVREVVKAERRALNSTLCVNCGHPKDSHPIRHNSGKYYLCNEYENSNLNKNEVYNVMTQDEVKVDSIKDIHSQNKDLMDKDWLSKANGINIIKPKRFANTTKTARGDNGTSN